MEKFKVGDIVYSPLWKGKGEIVLVFNDKTLEIKTKDTSLQIIDVYGRVLGEGEVVLFKNPIEIIETDNIYIDFETLVFNWIAVDPNGEIYGFENKPKISDCEWNIDKGGFNYLGTLPNPCEDWKESLRELKTPIKFELDF